MSHLHVADREVSELKANPGNARTHTPRQIRQIATSIERFGFNNPILIDGADMVVAGHGRLEAAKIRGMARVPTIRLEHLTDAEKRAYIIADNRLAELAGWDKETLAIELQNLLDADVDFEITDVGFDTADIDLLLTEPAAAENEDDELPAVSAGPAISRLGDRRLALNPGFSAHIEKQLAPLKEAEPELWEQAMAKAKQDLRHRTAVRRT